MFEDLRAKSYAQSPHALGTDKDNNYRDYIDDALEATIVVEVSGGVVQHVHGLKEGETYGLVDWDDIEEDRL